MAARLTQSFEHPPLMGLLIIIAALGHQYSIVLSIGLTFTALSKRIQALAADTSLSDQEFLNKSRLAIGIAWIATINVMNPASKEIFQQSKDSAFKILVSGLLAIFGLQVFS
jgi:hypothetical protein